MDNELSKEIEYSNNQEKNLYQKNTISKNRFIDEIKNGLGEEIKFDLKLINKKENPVKRFFKKMFKVF
tara:strand:- start:7584 stop:7787 length:204 start_codon:yes stop_codon:yes gene_type:complete